MFPWDANSVLFSFLLHRSDSSECKWRVMNDLFAFVAIREMFRELESEQKPTTPQDYEAAL